MRDREQKRHGVSVPLPDVDGEDEYAIKMEYLRAAIQKGLDAEAAGRVVDGEAAFRRLLERLK